MSVTVLLGPVPCRACGALVVWGTAEVRGNSGKVRRWRNPATGKVHRCRREE